MKKLIFTIAAALTVISGAITTLHAQTGAFAITGTGLGATQFVNSIHAVDSMVVWATVRDSSNAVPALRAVTSVDGGTTWTIKTMNNAAGYNPGGIFGLTAQKAFAAMFRAGGPGGRLLRTINGGTTWQNAIPTAFPSANGGFGNFVCFFDQNIGITMGDPTTSLPTNTGFEVWRTTDGGTTWARLPAASIPAPSSANEYGLVDDYFMLGNTCWFGTTSGRVYKSIDAGLTWTVATTPYATNNEAISGVAFTDANNGIGFTTGDAVAGTPHTTDDLVVTTDGGATWTLSTATVGAIRHSSIEAVPGLVGTYFLSSGNDSCRFSVNNGLTWTLAPYNGVDKAMGDIDFYDATHAFAAGNFLQGPIFIWVGLVPGATPLVVATRDIVAKTKAITVMPNPASSSLRLHTDAKATVVTVFDALGKSVFSQPVAADSDVNLNIESLTAGVYFLVTGNAQGEFFQNARFVKQ